MPCMFIPARSPLSAYGKKPERRRVAVAAIEWIDESVASAPDDHLVEIRTGSGDLHFARAGDLRAALRIGREDKP